MYKYLFINDTHLDLQRKAGATQTSMALFHGYCLRTLKTAFMNPAETLIVLGDLFANSVVSYTVIRQVAEILREWPGNILLVKGNHDLSKDRTKESALEFLSWLVPNAELIDEPTTIERGRVAVVPHMDNQELFDAAVAEAAKESEILLTHCNFNNEFAVNSDHSLNLTPAQAAEFEMVISGHEHNWRVAGNVHMLGSPWPCNIQEAEVDHCVSVWDGESAPQPIKIWSKDVGYEEQDWRALDLGNETQFVRVVGEASADEAASVIQEVSKFRGKTIAFMVSNSVKVGELDLGEVEDVSETLEGFDALGLLLGALSSNHREKIEEIRKKCNSNR